MAVRRRIKEICDMAEIAKELHSLTYMRVKNQLIEEFGEALFSSEKEHVKEMIRRTESKLRVKHDSSTSDHARRAITHASQRRARAMFASRATDVQKRRSRAHLHAHDDEDEPHESSPLLGPDAAGKSPVPPRRSSSSGGSGGGDDGPSNSSTSSGGTAHAQKVDNPPPLSTMSPDNVQRGERSHSREAIEQVPAPPPVKRRVRRLQGPPPRTATGRVPTASDVQPPAPPPRPSLA